MPSPNPTTRREYRGAAKSTTLSAQIVNGSDTSFTIADATGWPTGGTGKFVVTINAGQTDEEKILCLSRSGTTINVDTRGFDSSTAAGHASGATAVHTISAFDADEWNQHTNASAAVHGVAGAVVGTTDSQTLTNKTLTSPTVNSPTVNTPTIATPTVTAMTADAASTIGGVSGTSLAADRTAWTAYTPTFTNMTSPVGTFTYKLIGKTLHLQGKFSSGTVTASTSISLTLPAGLTAATDQSVLGNGWSGATTSTTAFSLWTVAAAATTLINSAGAGGSFLASLRFAAVIEVA